MFIPCFLVFLCRVSDLCPYIKMKSMQTTVSFATCKSPGLCPSQLCTFSCCQKGDGAAALHGLCWQSKACPDTRPLRARELYQEGKEQIFQLCLSSLHFKGCAWVWERIKRVCQSTCKTPHCCPNCQAVTQDRSTSPPVPSH